jgi:dipeptidyl-peptidase-3
MRCSALNSQSILSSTIDIVSAASSLFLNSAKLLLSIASLTYLASCSEPPVTEPKVNAEPFVYEADRFADIRVLRYQVPGFDELPLQQKVLLYYLSEAGMSGRDIFWDQNYRHNLRIRHLLEGIVRHYRGDRETAEFLSFLSYTKRVWFANGIHHHYSGDKFIPGFSARYLKELVANSPDSNWPLEEDQSLEEVLEELEPIIFDPTVDAKITLLNDGIDKVVGSAVNFYEDVTEEDVLAFYSAKQDANPQRPISHGLNSKLVRENGQLIEKVWKEDGMYGPAIKEITQWLELAVGVAENDKQRQALLALIKYYRSGDLADFDAYNVAWVADVDSQTDATNGFIEVYKDPLGLRGSYESVVSFKDEIATKRIGAIAAKAQWFEDNSTIADEHKKTKVVGITGKAITVVSETGDASPSTPIGINLPNSSWIRAEHGSKSVSLSNITTAYDSSETGALEEFAWDDVEVRRAREFGQLAGLLHTDMHEVIGHASGQLNPGVGTAAETLKQYASAMEEGRADLVALYYLMDPMLIELGVMPSLEVGKAEYDRYIRNGLLTQLYRVEPGKQIEEAHMRNRQEIASWAYEKGLSENVIERREKEGKTYFVVNDYQKLRSLFGQLLREHQRIKSEGDFEAARALIENYGTKVDSELHAEVISRYSALNVAPYSGFINPVLLPVYEEGGAEIIDIHLEYPTDFTEQMLDYSERYSFLPWAN